MANITKYKLLKDLPTWKAGTEFYLKENWSLYWKDGEKEIMVYFSETLEKFGILNNREWLEEIPQKPKSVWDLEDWDFCYILNESWSIISTVYCSTNDTFAKIISNWNMFLSAEEAQKELEKRNAIQRIKKYCWENNIELADTDFSNNINNKKFFIYYNIVNKKFFSDSFVYSICYNIFLFKNKSDAQKVIENCEDDLKIIFNI